jgi:hypothetical protein
MVEQPSDSARDDQTHARRAVLLGASNLVRTMPTVLEAALLSGPGACEVFFACGHGRSYGVNSSVLGRRLPGIIECGLWDALEGRPPARTTALITDIGNDLLYQAPPQQIAGWVETCLDRLLELGARPVVTSLPLMNLASLSPARFKFFRTLFFPPCRLTLEQVRAAAHELDERVRQLAQSRGVPVVAPRGDWYGIDPIHIRYGHAPSAWGEILAAWSDQPTPQAGRMSWRAWYKLHRLRPAQRWLWGIEQRAEQPIHRRDDGTTLWFY